LLTPLLLETE